MLGPGGNSDSSAGAGRATHTPHAQEALAPMPEAESRLPGIRRRTATMMELKVQLIPTGEIILSPGRNGHSLGQNSIEKVHGIHRSHDAAACFGVPASFPVSSDQRCLGDTVVGTVRRAEAGACRPSQCPSAAQRSV
ncbi:hypothetical protein AAFF_G00376400 [Aldrovandia affinis]|uniref:Uncharacterized protein n=1 Tax=Aldrovandia affinis TaxID=143900 RepID=A0AAD7WMP2_9TELE|nr:hypothetical protein AAFF_G00376400 [Aldrovandia affinis]